MMSVYEARATMALFNAERRMGSSNGAIDHISIAFGSLIRSGGGDIRGMLKNFPPVLSRAPSFDEWYEQTSPAREEAIAQRIVLQEKFAPFAPFVNDLYNRVATSAPLPAGVTPLHEGYFARAYKFSGKDPDEQLVVKVLKDRAPSSMAAEIETRAGGLIPAIGGAGLEQPVAITYEGAAITKFLPGEAPEDMDLSRVAKMSEADINWALDVADDAERRGISFDSAGDRNILYDVTRLKEDTPIWFLDFWARDPRHHQGRNVLAIVDTLKNAGIFVDLVQSASRRQAINPILEYVADEYERRHPDQESAVGRIRDSIH